jgi:hypothetical protein
MSWTINISGGGAQSLEDAGIGGLALNFYNLADDTLELREAPRALAASPAMEFGDTLQLYHGATCVFVGTVSTSAMRGLPGAIRAQSHMARNIFWELSRLVYEQEWHDGAASTYYKGRVKLGKDVDDARLSVGAAIKDVLDFAIGEGLSFTYHAADLTALTAVPPDSEHVDITCIEAIRLLLNWAPSVATEVEYATGAPKIRFIKRGAASAVDFTVTDLASLEIRPLPEQRLEGVVIRYEQTNNADGETWTTVTEDATGASTGLNVLKQTIDLYGLESSSTEQSVEVVTGPGPSSATDDAWWAQYVPGLAKLTGLTVKDGETLPAGWSVLLSGTVPDWTGKETDTLELNALASGTIDGNTLTDIPIAVSLTITDADTDTYSTLTSVSYTPPEDIPVGLAAAIYAERSELHYEGAFSLHGASPRLWDDGGEWDDSAAWEESHPLIPCTTGQVVNLLPGGTARTWDDSEAWDDSATWEDTESLFSGYEAIRAVVGRVTLSVEPGRSMATIVIGPPRHLQVQDFVALLRATRSRRTSYWSRKEPAQARGGEVQMGGGSPNHNGNMIGGGAGLPSTEGKEDGMALLLGTEGSGEEAVLKADWGHLLWVEGSSGGGEE